jgi:hypothetical protein
MLARPILEEKQELRNKRTKKGRREKRKEKKDETAERCKRRKSCINFDSQNNSGNNGKITASPVLNYI